MSIDAVAVKRLRRTFEPEEKAWHDDALQLPWEEVQPPLHKATIFSLKNVFFFSHATAIQALALASFSQDCQSATIDAPTGSGKTLAFLIPLMERTMRACEAYLQQHQRPPVSRDILGIVISPSRTLAEQTFVVARSLASRLPYNIQFSLCDGVIEKPAAVVERLTNGARGAGTFIVTTPKDLAELVPLLEESFEKHTTPAMELEALLADQDEETRRRYLAKRQRTETTRVASDAAAQPVRFFSVPNHRFVVVVDEADLVFNSPDMRAIVTDFIENLLQGRNAVSRHKRGSPATRRKGHKNASEEDPTRMYIDYAFVGATVATSSFVKDYAEAMCKRSNSQHNLVASRSNEDFVSQLQNRYLVCDAHCFLPVFVQMMNLHASKKHFVFFNSFRALLFVQKLFSHLTEGPRPLLFINNVYVMYEGMSESARIVQYNKFLTHQSSKGEKQKAPQKALSDAEKKNQIFTSGWKRDGKAVMGSGAILLCTDIAAFGLDVRDVDYVYHFEPPSTVRSYIHRVGRVGRMGMRGSSILLLPCIAVDSEDVAIVRERKSNSTRFNTVTNTKKSTSGLQGVRMTSKHLSLEGKRYVEDLAKHSSLGEYSLPPFAPITSTLRNFMAQDEKLVRLAKAAAVSMCAARGAGEEGEPSWFTPKIVLRALLLD